MYIIILLEFFLFLVSNRYCVFIVQEQYPELGKLEGEFLDLLINRELLAVSIGEHIKQHQIPTVCMF